MNEFRGSPRMRNDAASNLESICLGLISKNVDFSRVISSIDEIVTLLKAEQHEDDGKRVYCIKSFGQTEGQAKVPTHEISDHRDTTADHEDQLSNTNAQVERIAEESCVSVRSNCKETAGSPGCSGDTPD